MSGSRTVLPYLSTYSMCFSMSSASSISLSGFKISCSGAGSRLVEVIVKVGLRSGEGVQAWHADLACHRDDFVGIAGSRFGRLVVADDVVEVFHLRAELGIGLGALEQRSRITPLGQAALVFLLHPPGLLLPPRGLERGR